MFSVSRDKLMYVGTLLLAAVLSGVVTFVILKHVAPTPQLVVSEDTLPLPTTSCVSEGREDFECYEVYYQNLVKTSGVKAAFDDLKVKYQSVVSVQNQCHQITHVIGRAGSALSGGVGDAFSQGDAMCWSGYYHGVMEEVLKGVGLEELPSKLNNICDTIPGKAQYSFAYYNCVHGLGHGIMQLYNDDLFASLDMCTVLTGDWEKTSCGGGVFMENIMVEDRGAISKYLKADDPVYPCNAVPDLFKDQCYLMQTSHMLNAFDEDFSKVFATCDTVEDAFRPTCYQSVGRDASGRSVSEAEQTKATCMLGRDDIAQENCIIGAVKDFISFFHSDKEAKEFCAILKPNLNTICLAVAKDYYSIF